MLNCCFFFLFSARGRPFSGAQPSALDADAYINPHLFPFSNRLPSNTRTAHLKQTKRENNPQRTDPINSLLCDPLLRQHDGTAANKTLPHPKELIKSSIHLRVALDKQNPHFPLHWCSVVQSALMYLLTFNKGIDPLSRAGEGRGGCKSRTALEYEQNFPLTQLRHSNNVTMRSNQF